MKYQSPSIIYIIEVLLVKGTSDETNVHIIIGRFSVASILTHISKYFGCHQVLSVGIKLDCITFYTKTAKWTFFVVPLILVQPFTSLPSQTLFFNM